VKPVYSNCNDRNCKGLCPLCFVKNNAELYKVISNYLSSLHISSSNNSKCKKVDASTQTINLNTIVANKNIKCQDYVNNLPTSGLKNLNAEQELFSDNATIGEDELTNINGNTLSRRFLKTKDKRIVSNVVLSSIENQKIIALVDTGASISVINSKLVQDLENSVYKRNKIKPFSVSLSIENNLNFAIDEEVEFCFKLNNELILWRFFIVENLSNSIVLGIDFLSAYHVDIQCNPFEVKLRRKKTKQIMPFSSETQYTGSIKSTNVDSSAFNEHFPFSKPNIPIPKPVDPVPILNKLTRVSQRTVLAPLSYTKVSLLAKGVNGSVILKPRKEIENTMHLLIGNCILDMENGRGDIYVCNPTKRRVTLNSHTFIGTLDTHNREDVVCDMDDLCSESKHILASISANGNKKDDTEELLKLLDFGEKLTQAEKYKLAELVRQFSDVFAYRKGDRGSTSLVKHTIEIDNCRPIKQRAYRQAFVERQKTTKIIDELIKDGIVEPSSSPWSSPVVLVKKKDDSLRFCVDYRKLNAVTKKDNYPLPRIDDALDRLHGAKYFSSLDCDQAYWQVEVDEKDQEKTAFITPDGLFQFKYMPFGLCNAPATFQRLIDVVLGTLKWTISLVYLDDIVVYSSNFDEHIVNLSKVFLALRKANLKLKPAKCKLADNKLLFLGHIISDQGVAVNPAKVNAVSDFPTPKCKKDVQSFVALCSYYRRFVKNFAKIAKPLHKLTEDNIKFQWNDEAEHAFTTLKSKLVSSDVLAYPDDDAETKIHCDASKLGLGATLVQIQDGIERVVAFASRSLKKYEKNYSATELECLAAVFAVERFRQHLYGKKFEIVTDHCALCYVFKLKDPGSRLAKMAMRLQPYDFTVVYRSGKKHIDADCLSRNPVDPAPATDEPSIGFSDLLCKIDGPYELDFVQLQNDDKNFSKIRNQILTRKENANESNDDDCDEYMIKDDILYKINDNEDGKLWRLCIPSSMRKKVMDEIHVSTIGHLGLLKTYMLLKARYYWPKMYKQLRKYINSCKECQFFNRRGGLVPGPMQLVAPPALAFHRVGIDFQGPYPITKNRNTYIFVIIDHLTRYVEAWPVKNVTSKCAISILEECVIFKHSCPKEILCDQGSSFTSAEFKEFCKSYHIKLVYTSAFHPNTNGVCERANDTLKRIIAKYVNKNHKDWDRFVTRAAFAVNVSVNSVTGQAPYNMLYGREPFLPCDSALPTIPDELHGNETRESHMQSQLDDARKNTIASQKKSKERFDKKHIDIKYQPGDLVLVADFTRIVGKVTKWLRKWKGPYEIIESMGPINYIIKDLRLNSRKVLKNVSVRHLKPYYVEYVSGSERGKNDDHKPSTRNSIVIEDDDSIYELGDEVPSISYKSRRNVCNTRKSKTLSRALSVSSHHSDDDNIFPPIADQSVSPQPDRTVNASLVESDNSDVYQSSCENTLDASSSEEESEIVCSVASESSDLESVRRSGRIRKPVDRYGDYSLPIGRRKRK